jgi:type IV secretion system protein VirB4
MGVGGNAFEFDDSAKNRTTLALCPLKDIGKGKAHKTWAASFIERCCTLQNVKITPEHRSAIHDALAKTADGEKKTLTDFCANLQNLELRSAMKHYTLDGAMGWILDGDEKNSRKSNFDILEMSTILELGDVNSLPVLDSILHDFEHSLDGRPTLLPIDEAWLPLAHPVFRDRIKSWLKTLRDKNAVAVLATQQSSDLFNSGILDVISEACPTKFFLANELAHNDSSSFFYKQLGLNHKEIQIISNMIGKREIYCSSPNGNRRFQLDLGPYALKWVGKSGTKNIRHLKSLLETYPNNWKSHWLGETV